MSAVDQVAELEQRAAAVQAARARVDQARAVVARLEREIAALAWHPRKNAVALERFRLELGAAMLERRNAQRALIASMGAP